MTVQFSLYYDMTTFLIVFDTESRSRNTVRSVRISHNEKVFQVNFTCMIIDHPVIYAKIKTKMIRKSNAF